MTLREDTQQREPTFEDLKLLAQVSQLLTLLDLDRVLEDVIELMRNTVGAAKASLILQQGAEIDWNHILITRDLDQDESFRVVNRVMDDGLAGWVTRNREAALVFNTQTDERWHFFDNDPYQVGSALCVPFIHDEQVVAVLTLVHPEPEHFTPRHLNLMTIVANQATVAVRNAQLFSESQAQRRQLSAVLHAIPDALLVVDRDGNILLINSAAAELLGCENDSQRAIGEQLAKFSDQEQALVPVLEIVSAEVADETYWTFETRSAKRRRDFQVNISMWHEEDDSRQSGYVVVMHDVTMLRDLHRFKDDMLKMASHDLRSPLALITGYVDMIELDSAEGAPLAGHINAVRRSIDRMDGLIRGLLRVDEIKTSPLELQEEVKIAELIETVFGNMQPAAEHKGQQLTSAIQLDDLPGMVVDPLLIRQAMENFVGNAIKYTPDGGQIRIQASYDPDRFYFIVEDNGIGIAQEYQARLFESRYRVKQPGTEHIEGQGLGLNLVKTIIERHNGEVWVESEENVGSRFGFWLPL